MHRWTRGPQRARQTPRGDQAAREDEDEGAAEEDDEDPPLLDILVRDFTAHGTAALRPNLSVQPHAAIMAVTHARAALICFSVRMQTRSALGR